MKIFTLSVLFLFSCASAMAQDVIANGGFEQWTQQGGYTDPNSWNCANPLSSAIGVITCRQDSTYVHSGSYSCNLVTLYVSAISSNIPGVITTGVIPVSQTGSISGGALIHSRPMSMQGWFRYVPAGHDTAGVTINLIKGDSIIGYGGMTITDTLLTWTRLAFNINYISGSIPDTSQITVVSSIGSGIAHSSLWVDDLGYSYNGAGINEVNNTPFSIYPNPASQEINIDNQNMQVQTLNLYAADGQLIKTLTMHEGLNKINVNALPAGFYLLSGLGANGQGFHSSVIIDK